MMKTWQIILATIAIFVAGLVTGGATALGLAGWARNRASNSFPRENAPGGRSGQQMQAFGPQLMRNLANRLDLSPEQRARIGPIVKRAVQELARERREVQLESALLIEKMQDQISEVLTPDQRVKFEDLVRKQRDRLQQFKRPMPVEPSPAEPSPAPFAK